MNSHYKHAVFELTSFMIQILLGISIYFDCKCIKTNNPNLGNDAHKTGLVINTAFTITHEIKFSQRITKCNT
ncbi:hypothetical protein HanHA300_Chr14g0519621 [Helianthus annuus]|nr:hypothetical protein HanHA300_Chr14g0519621 [Helianthus annuus]KAJ0485298.1 hypothetical protein HanHA89_Chr14g0566641 [Helianthus annuus]KAJ0655842.1 hypothetical protein HanLR1_Chr14g0528911 [Helianthus annuus]